MITAICQIAMHWTIEENVENITKWIKECAEKGVELAIFPECALTGYHRKMPKITNSQALQNAFQKIAECVKENNIYTIIGAPYIDSDTPNNVFNSALFFSPKTKKYELTSKNGLTNVETLYFTKGEKRTIFEIEGFKVGVIFCIEVNDKEDVLADFKDADLDLLTWISYIKWDDNSIPENSINYQNSLDISNALNVPIINVNWANALNDPTLKGMGGSRYIKDGKIQFKLPEDTETLELIKVEILEAKAV